MLVGMLVCIVEYRLVIAVCVSILDSSTSAKTYGRLVDLYNERASALSYEIIAITMSNSATALRTINGSKINPCCCTLHVQ